MARSIIHRGLIYLGRDIDVYIQETVENVAAFGAFSIVD